MARSRAAGQGGSESRVDRGGIALTAIVIAAYFVTLHVLIVSGRLPVLAVAMIVGPWLIALSSALRRMRLAMRIALVALALASIVAIVGVASRHHAPVAESVDGLLFLESSAFLLGLAVMFATTLRRGRVALVTRLARAVHGNGLPDSAIPYTRKVTVAWALFFSLSASISTLLYFTESRAVWSTFVNLMVAPLTIAMFAVEYLIRKRVLRELPHASIMAGASVFQHHMRSGSSDSASPS